MITGFDCITLPVRDLDRAVAFYRDTLGLSPLGGVPGMTAELELSDGNTIALTERTAWLPPGVPPREPLTTGAVGLAFADLEGALAKLRNLGHADQDAPWDTPSCHMAMAHDPEGNALALHRRKAEPGREHKLDFFYLPVADMARAKVFYRDALGLKLNGEFDDGEMWVEFELPDGNTLALGELSSQGIVFAPVTGAWPVLATSDLTDRFERLKAQGFARAPEIIETPICFMGLIQDSEGNALVLHHRKQLS